MPTLEGMGKVGVFEKLHEEGCFVMPNPWDVGTARYLEAMGFRALATTSAGFAFSRGMPDAEGAITRDQMLNHIAEMAASVAVPMNADFEAGYAHEPGQVAENVRLCVQAGVAGLSIEDATGNKKQPLYELAQGVERIRAARKAIDASGTGALLTARAECHLVGHANPLAESVQRLRAYRGAGADVLFAPGVQDREGVNALLEAADGKPLNVLMGADNGMTVSDLAALGVRRISLGSGLARAAWAGFLRAVKPLAEAGQFGGLAGSVPYAELNKFFGASVER